ncbi:MAG: xylulokinase [Pseudomonadota bacterium]
MFLGLDLGTSGLKALLIDDRQGLIAEATAPLSVNRPAPGWSEQDPAHWVEAAETALAALAEKVSLRKVKGIGLSGQMHGAVLLDNTHTVLRPAILWNDTRASEEAAELDADADFHKISGNVVFPGFTAPKLLWVKRHEPKIFDATALVLLPKDYLRLWLTGEAVSEPSDAAGTSWLDTGARTWSGTLLERTDLSLDHMPRLVEGPEVSGGLRQDIGERYGIPSGTPVAGGAGDNAATAIGMGVIAPGQAFLSLGTSGVLFAASDGYRPAPETSVHSFCHALPQRWHQMGVILAATDALNWFATLTGEDAADLTHDLGDLQAPGRPLFLPYLGGERTPHNDTKVRGALIGLSHESDREALTRAVLEGVTFAVCDCQAALAATGTEIERLIAVGGGSRSDHWLHMMATALGVPIAVPAAGDFGAAFGAARLGLMAGSGADASVVTPPKIAHEIAPNGDLKAAFEDAHQRYRATYSALKDLS